MRPYTNIWKVTIATKGHPKNVGTWSDQLSTRQVDGRQAFVRIQIFKIINGSTNTLITAFDAKNMRPFSSSLLTSDGDATLRSFVPGKVQIVDASGSDRGVPTVHTKKVQADAYDFNAGMYGILLVGLPLRAHLSGVFETYGQADASIEHVSYTVQRQEQVEAKPHHFVRAWVVDAHYLDAHRAEGDAKMRFWITKLPPYIIKLVYDVPSEKQIWYYTMI